MRRSNSRAKRLARVPLFAGIGHELNHVVRHGDLLSVNEGSLILGPGQLHRHFYLLLSGAAELHDEQGKVQVLEAGDSYGAVQILAKAEESRRAKLDMVSDGELLIIGSREFTGLVDTLPKFTRRIAEDFARRLQKTA